MTRRLPVVAAFLAVTACTGGGTSGTPGAASRPITVTTDRASVLANGKNMVAIHFDGATTAPVVVQTQRGLLGTSARVQVNAPSGDVMLVTCDASVDSS